MAKLEPVYQTGLDTGDADTVLRVVELQARIAGLIIGGSIMPGAAAVRQRRVSARRMRLVQPIATTWNFSAYWTKTALARKMSLDVHKCP